MECPQELSTSSSRGLIGNSCQLFIPFNSLGNCYKEFVEINTTMPQEIGKIFCCSGLQRWEICFIKTSQIEELSFLDEPTWYIFSAGLKEYVREGVCRTKAIAKMKVPKRECESGMVEKSAVSEVCFGCLNANMEGRGG